MLSHYIPNDLSDIFVDFKFSWDLGLYLAPFTKRSQHSPTLIAGLAQPGIHSISLQDDFLQTSRPVLASSSLPGWSGFTLFSHQKNIPLLLTTGNCSTDRMEYMSVSTAITIKTMI
jgi:hypothetical protein